MSSYDVLKTTQLYQTDPDVRRRVDLRIAKDRVFEDKRLFNLDIEITTDCNLKCRTCYNPYLKHSSLSLKQLEYRKGNNLAPECRSCQLAAFCGGCRARTYYRTGDWFAKDTWCPLINKN